MVGKRHNLEFINIFTDDEKINQYGGAFEGIPPFRAREAVTDALKKKGLFKETRIKETKTNEMCLRICSRSKDVVEPIIKPQWYIKCSDMGNEALNAVADDENRKLEIIPRQYTAGWKDGFITFMIGVSRGNFGGVTVFRHGMLFLRVITTKNLEDFLSDGWFREVKKRLKQSCLEKH
ncbi:putative valine--tRNA ligase [Rosa chinensis]|uniref:valine--tRNA ligase n=1 Tax=Rosa chinensis TaxID=74649 RepID=A0A2P6PFW6_ROSCH|nr:putative valine--tRNA ligase [Rosa chinensis]